MKYQQNNVPLVVIAGQEYGTGSSRDWAAKGTRLLGVKAVIAQSFERIHRSNLVGMGVLPCQFKEGANAQSLNLNGTETFDITGLETSDSGSAPGLASGNSVTAHSSSANGGVRPRQDVTLTIHRADGSTDQIPLTLRIDTPIEIDYYLHGGILPYVLRQLLAGTTGF
jgi:aconitate hydratase